MLDIGRLTVKPLTFAILRLLADGDFHSGERIATELGVSRASVWQALQGLPASGLALHSVRGRGYQLMHPVDWLDEAAIKAALGSQAPMFDIAVCESVGSTNTMLLAQAQQGVASGRCIAAEWQSAGRGRLGRSWLAPLGGSLAFSLLWRFEFGISRLSGLSLAVGVAIVRALESCGIEGVGLKWPNDVLCHGGKLAGVLIEVQGDALGPSAAVIGIGLNMRLAEDQRKDIDQLVADLAQSGQPLPSRNELLAVLLAELAAVLHTFSQTGFAGLRAEWERHHLFQDRPVMLATPNGEHRTGIVRGVAQDGALVLDDGLASQRYHVGEISLRGVI